MTNKSKREILDAAHADLRKNYPVIAEKKPLAIGVYEEVLAIVLDPKIVSFILGKHTRSRKYLKAVSLGGKRFHLDGSESEEISELHQADAVRKIADRDAEIAKKKIVKEEPKTVGKRELTAEKKDGLAFQTTKITVKKKRTFQVDTKA